MAGRIESRTEMYGLEGAWRDQYGAFWGRLVHGDFGVSFFQYPAPVSQLVGNALPWTLGLLLTTTAISWTFGNIVGGLAGYYSQQEVVESLDAAAMLVCPLPYYIFAFALLIFS
jgi:peptide/nickel transport system permease protein